MPEIDDDQVICEPCAKKKRGPKRLVDTLTPDELSIEQELIKDTIPSVLELRKYKQVPDAQSQRMRELRIDEGLTLQQTSDQMFVEFGDRWALTTVLYHTDPAFREKCLKDNLNRYLDGTAPGKELLSSEYGIARNSLISKMKTVGYSAKEIHELLESPEYQRRGGYKAAEDAILEMSPQTLQIVKDVKELNDPSFMNYKIADTNSISTNAAMDMKRQLEGAGMKDLADAIDLAKIKKIKIENERRIDVGGWDRIDG